MTVISTGGTAAKLRATGLEVKDVSEITKSPEMLGASETLVAFVLGFLLRCFCAPRRALPASVHAVGAVSARRGCFADYFLGGSLTWQAGG